MSTQVMTGMVRPTFTNIEIGIGQAWVSGFSAKLSPSTVG